MYSGIETFRDKYKHDPALQSGKTPQGDTIYRCKRCSTVAFVMPNNQVYGYGTRTLCPHPTVIITPTLLEVETTEYPNSVYHYTVPNIADLPALVDQLVRNASGLNHKMEPLPNGYPLLIKNNYNVRCAICKAPITCITHDRIDDQYAGVTMAWKLSQVCRGFSLSPTGEPVWPVPYFPAVAECCIARTGEEVNLCQRHIDNIANELMEVVPLVPPMTAECAHCIYSQWSSAAIVLDYPERDKIISDGDYNV